jgi:hypothetical protein
VPWRFSDAAAKRVDGIIMPASEKPAQNATSAMLAFASVQIQFLNAAISGIAVSSG